MSTETLGHLIEQVGGSIKTGPFGTTLKANEYSETGVPIISVGEVGYGSLSLRGDTPRAPVEVTKRLREYLLETGDIVFGRKGAVDRSAWVKESENGWFLGSDGIRVRLPTSVDSRFVAYQFQSDATKTWLLQHASGSTMLSLNQKILARIPLVLPTLPEQRAIAEVLGALDDKIAANIKLAITADEWVRACLAGITASAEETMPVSELVVNRKELAEPSTLDPASKYLGLEHLPRRSMWASSAGTAESVMSTKAKFQRGDILFGKLRPYFHKVIVVPSDGVCSTDILVLNPINRELAGFALASVASDFIVERATAASEGTRMPRTSWKDLASIEVPWPGMTEAKKFSARVSEMRGSVEALLGENQTLAATRDVLLPQLMSGKLRVRDAEKVLENAGV